ncbi:MAG: MBL fold metallo-hydrolase [Spirochaetaceae bacterium]|nr:MBL fold metallo-hydrolase [Spirochaetaceae bacterium]
MSGEYTHTQPHRGMFRIVCPGYHPGPGSMPGYGTAIITVVEGRELSLVFDTGYGDPGLRRYIEALTDKPLVVALSHSHPDHVGCNAEFEEVWIRPEEVESMRRLCPTIGADGARRYGVRLIDDGQIFDLGGRRLRTVHIPGHAPGAIGLIDEETGILLSGDSVLKRMLIFQTRSVFLDALERLDSLEFSDVLGAHWPEPLGRQQVRRAIELLRDYRPDMEVSAPWNLGGSVVDFRMFYRGKAFEDPEFVAFGYMAGISI